MTIPAVFRTAQNVVSLPLWLQPGHRNSQLQDCVHKGEEDGVTASALCHLWTGTDLTWLQPAVPDGNPEKGGSTQANLSIPHPLAENRTHHWGVGRPL